MENRKNVVFGAAVLIIALAFGVGANQWLKGGEGLASDFQQSTTVSATTGLTTTVMLAVDQQAANQVAQVNPEQAILANLYDEIAPSVVNIQVTAPASAEEQGALPGQGNSPNQGLIQAQGTGWIYDNDGHIVTNNHVAGDALTMTVYFSNGMWAPAKLVAADPSADLAVIQVTPPQGVAWKPLPLATPNSLRVGFSVAAIGSPFGLQETMTAGIVSALGRSFPTGSEGDGSSTYSLPDVIQTDTAINPGNSGGPLLNLQGQVVGVNFAINSTSGSNSGVGFAIPISVVQKVVPALITDGKVDYSYLGLAGVTLNAEVVSQFNIQGTPQGIYIAQVVEGGPAAQAGLKEGDVIVGINNQAITDFEQLISYLFNSTKPGDTVTLNLSRNGQATTVEMTLQARPAAQTAQQGNAPQMQITISDAINIATQALEQSGQVNSVDSATATASQVNGRGVWIVTLTSGNQTATVTVDGTTGDVLDVNVQ